MDGIIQINQERNKLWRIKNFKERDNEHNR